MYQFDISIFGDIFTCYLPTLLSVAGMQGLGDFRCRDWNSVSLVIGMSPSLAMFRSNLNSRFFLLQVSFERVNKAEDGSETVKHVKRMLYHRMNVLPQKKVMTFNRHLDDFKFNAHYTDLDFLNEEEKRLLF